jgi:hypothetical protein
MHDNDLENRKPGRIMTKMPTSTVSGLRIACYCSFQPQQRKPTSKHPELRAAQASAALRAALNKNVDLYLCEHME